MARAKRHFLTGHLWHITHRCHKREFLLKLVKDRQRWLFWLYQAKKRYGLKVLNYMVTSNHIHLLVSAGEDRETIPKSIRLIAGRTAQEYNQRKRRNGAFWEDRYHATAVQTGKHLIRCLIYIDLNMVRAGVVADPKEWRQSGYNEIQNPKDRYGIIDFKTLLHLLPTGNMDELRIAHRKWIDEALQQSDLKREAEWTQSVAVGDSPFLENIKSLLGFRAIGRRIHELIDSCQLRENQTDYGHPTIREDENAFEWSDASMTGVFPLENF